MDIKKGNCYPNRTWRYLYPCLKMYGETFKEKQSSVFLLAVGVGDEFFKVPSIYKEENFIYLLLDKTYKPKQFENYLNWIISQKFYVTDYSYDDIITGYKHLVVVKIPPEFKLAYLNFQKGLYSEMYTEKQLEFLFVKDLQPDKYPHHLLWFNAVFIFLKDYKYREIFLKKLELEFGKLNLKIKDIEDHELEFPMSYKPETEIFNYGR